MYLQDVPSSDAGIDLNTAHMMSSQAVSSGAHVKGSGYTGAEASGYSAIPEHITKAKQNGSVCHMLFLGCNPIEYVCYVTTYVKVLL